MPNSSVLHRPPFCPNPKCTFHTDPTGWSFARAGFYERKREPLVVQRYRCSRCKRNFSTQTYRATYWLKRPDLFRTIYGRLISCSCLRQIARDLEISPTTVQHHAERLGRHALLWLDGFESFAFSQFYPSHLNIAVGAESHYVYAFTEAELRRKGRMTKEQKRKREKEEATYGRPEPKAIEREMGNLLDLVYPEPGRATIVSDEHQAYPRAFKKRRDLEIGHQKTSSKAARTHQNPLFPVNRLDLLARHCSANHKRETVAYSKTRQGMIERFSLFVLWHNVLKSFSEKSRDAPPGARLGVSRARTRMEELLEKRRFPSLTGLRGVWSGYYDRDVPTRRIPKLRRHICRYAY